MHYLERQAGQQYVTKLKVCVMALGLKTVKSTLWSSETIWGVTVEGFGGNIEDVRFPCL